MVDGTKVATRKLLHDKPGQFFDETYPLADALTRGKAAVTVKLQAHPGQWAGGLFGARMLRREGK